jgi:acetylglutamate kinase
MNPPKRAQSQLGRPSSLSAIDPQVKAAILAEAIPYIRRFGGKVVVVKYGGSALNGSVGEDQANLEEFAEDVVLMRSVGMLPVVVHGGGPQIGALMERLGKTPEFRDGQRVTDADTLDIARMVLVGKVNRDIVRALNMHGSLAVGLSGEDAGFITAAERDPALGFVGDVVAVDSTILTRLVTEGLVPVVATIASDVTGQAYNINADTVAGAIAGALVAEKLIFLTDVSGVRAIARDEQSVVTKMNADDLEALIANGAIGEGMIPKAQACARAVRNGVGSAHILDGRVSHALLLEIFTESGVGTMVSAK